MIDADVTVIQVDPVTTTTLVLKVPDSAVNVIGMPGTGDGGSSGHLNPVVDWFTGVGPPPDALIGAGPGDMYIDVTTGVLYQLR